MSKEICRYKQAGSSIIFSFVQYAVKHKERLSKIERKRLLALVHKYDILNWEKRRIRGLYRLVEELGGQLMFEKYHRLWLKGKTAKGVKL